MAEILSLVSSIAQVASFGLSLSKTLHDYAETVVRAEERLKGLDNEIKFTSEVISQLGSQLEDTLVQRLASDETIRLAQEGVAECEAIFQAMEDVIAKIRKSGRAAKWTLYFRDSRIELLRSNLERMKGNLNLLLQGIIVGRRIATERLDDTSTSAELRSIEELRIEKEYYTQRYLEMKRKYDNLLETVNSTSSLGSYSSVASSSRAVPENGPPAATWTNEAATTAVGYESHDLGPPSRLEDDQSAQASSAKATMPYAEDTPVFYLPDKRPEKPDPNTESSQDVVVGFDRAAATNATARSSYLPRPPQPAYLRSRPEAEPAFSATNPASTMANGSLEKGSKSHKRGGLAGMAKQAAKRAGIALSNALGVVLPLPIRLILVKRWERWRDQSAPNSFCAASCPSPESERIARWLKGEPSEPKHPNVSQLLELPQPIDQEPAISYSSNMLVAELPSTPEMMAMGAGDLNMALVGRLMSIDNVRQYEPYPGSRPSPATDRRLSSLS